MSKLPTEYIFSVADKAKTIDNEETLNDIIQRINHSVVELSLKDFNQLKHFIANKIRKKELLPILKDWAYSTKMKIIKAKRKNQKAKQEKSKIRSIKEKKDKRQKEFIEKSTKELRRFNDLMDDKAQTKSMIKKFEKEYKLAKEKSTVKNKKTEKSNTKGTKTEKQNTNNYSPTGVIITETEEDPLHRK